MVDDGIRVGTKAERMHKHQTRIPYRRQLISLSRVGAMLAKLERGLMTCWLHGRRLLDQAVQGCQLISMRPYFPTGGLLGGQKCWWDDGWRMNELVDSHLLLTR